MTPNTHSAFISLPGGAHAFIDGIPNECDHDSKGDVVLVSKSGKVIYWHTYRQWAHLTTQARMPLVHAYHESIDDRILEGGVSCSKCKKPFHPGYF